MYSKEIIEIVNELSLYSQLILSNNHNEKVTDKDIAFKIARLEGKLLAISKLIKK